MKKSKNLVRLAAVAVLLGGLSSCGETASNYSYKGKTSYKDIATTILADKNLSLDGLVSDKFSITGYQQGFDTTETSWITGLQNMVNSGEEVILNAGASDLVLGMSGFMASTTNTAVAGGVDSLTSDFVGFFRSGKYLYDDGKYSSMPGPMIAALLRDLEGNKLQVNNTVPYLNQGTWSATSADELLEMMTLDGATKDESGNITDQQYVYDEHVVSYMLDASADTFKTMTEKNDFASAKGYKTSYGSTAVKSLKKAYKIGMIRNDGTSSESVAFADYLSYLSNKLNFTIDIQTTTSGDATADLNWINTWGSKGYDAVICLSNSDNYGGLQAANSHNMKYCMFAGHPYADDEADMVATYPNSYTGSIGPTTEAEAVVGYKLAKFFIAKNYTKFSIFGGAVGYGSEMHAYRVAGMLAAMVENETGVSADLA